jgi:hypothetical protein
MNALLFASLVLGGWGSSGCGSVEPIAVHSEYEWRAEGKIYRMYWRGRPTNRTAPRCDCGCTCNSECTCNTGGEPCSADCTCAPQAQKLSNNHGLIVDKLLNGDKREAFYLGDREIGADEVPDVSAKPYLTIVSADPAVRQRILRDLDQAGLRNKFQVQAEARAIGN